MIASTSQVIEFTKNLEDLLLKAACCKDYNSEYSFVIGFYKDDFDSSLLKVHLELFGTCVSQLGLVNPTLKEIRDYFKSLSPAVRSSMSEVCTVLKLIMVLPATNAVSERSASALRQVKTYLRTTMTQARLNSLMTLHIHREYTDCLPLESCLSLFVEGNQHREGIFGHF